MFRFKKKSPVNYVVKFSSKDGLRVTTDLVPAWNIDNYLELLNSTGFVVLGYYKA